jgi:hypothetical protein
VKVFSVFHVTRKSKLLPTIPSNGNVQNLERKVLWFLLRKVWLPFVTKMGRILQISKKWDNCSHHDPTHEANVDLSLEIEI